MPEPDENLTSIPEPARPKRGRPPIRSMEQRMGVARKRNLEHHSTSGKILPNCPMDPDELAEQWQIGAGDVEGITIKILRQKIGTMEQELMDSFPLVDYDGRRIAAQFGPGTYYIKTGPGPYAKHAIKLSVSEALARTAGFGRVPTRAADLAAERTIRQATQGPVDQVDLLAAIETILDRRQAEQSRGLQTAGPAQIQTDPMAAMKAQFEQIQTMMAFMASLEERAIKTVEMRMGRDVQIPAEDTNASLLEKLLPKVVDIFGNLMATRNAPAAPTPAPVVIQAQPQPPQPAAPAPAEAPKPEGIIMPLLTEHEQAAITAAVSMLRPHAAMIAPLTETLTDERIVDELEPWIPAGVVPSLEALAAVVAKHGPAVLASIHPGLATDRWAGILPKLVAACSGD